MKEFRKPDLNAPRFRPKRLNILNAAFFKRFVDRYPKYKDMLSLQDVRQVVSTYNGALYQMVIEHRDGVELPEQLGNIFIGSCPRKILDNPDWEKSIQTSFRVQNKNWESDGYTAKIFYTNCEGKYKFKFHELWSFTAVRDFKREVAHTYPQQWKKYIMVDNDRQISALFRKAKQKEFILKEVEKTLETYDEFDFN